MAAIRLMWVCELPLSWLLACGFYPPRKDGHLRKEIIYPPRKDGQLSWLLACDLKFSDDGI